MKLVRWFTIMMLITLALASATLVQAKDMDANCPALSPEAMEAIIATPGTAIQKYCPEYGKVDVASARVNSPTREMLDEIIGTRGSAALRYFPQYMLMPIPVTSSSRHTQPTQTEIDELIATRGVSAMKDWNK